MNEGYKYLFWDDSDVMALIRFSYPHLLSLFNELQITVMRADLFRYLVVYKFGGFYADVDTLCLKPLDTWVTEQNTLTELNGKNVTSKSGKVLGIFGIETDLLYVHKNEPGRRLENMIFSHPAQMSQWAFASAPETDFMRDIVANTTQNLMYYLSLSDEDANELKSTLNLMLVIKLTGPEVPTKVVHDHLTARSGVVWSELTSLREAFTAGDVLRIHPITAFNNGENPFMGQGKSSDLLALVNHLYAGSWKKL
jgi:alpha 1,6-mannosyltransferase